MQCALELQIHTLNLDVPTYNAIRDDPRQIPYVLTNQPADNFEQRIAYFLVQGEDSPEVYSKTCSDLKTANGRTYYEVITATATVRFNDLFERQFPEEDSLFNNIYLQPASPEDLPPGITIFPVTLFELQYIAPEHDPEAISVRGYQL
jgi:hypothetical protein